MPQVNDIGSGLTASEARATINSPSWRKYGASFVDHAGVETPIPKGEDILARFAELVKGWEKDGLLEKKNGEYTAKIKDTFARSGPPKEWDHLVFSFSKEDSAKLSLDDKEAYRKALIEALCLREDVTGKGHRMMLLADGHDDTGNYHIHIMLHRHPVDKDDKYIGPGIKLGTNSVAAIQAKVLNDVLLERDLQPIKDWRRGDVSVFEDRSTSSDVKDSVSRMIEEAGGEASLDVQKGMTPEAGKRIVEDRPKFTPEEKQITEFIKLAEREATQHAKQAQEAAHQVALGQHALKAIEERQRAEEAAQKAIAEKDAAVIERDVFAKDLGELQKNYEQASASLKDVSEKHAQVGDFIKSAAEALPKEVLEAPVTEQAKWIAGAVKEVVRAFEPVITTAPPEIQQAPVTDRVAWVAKEYVSTVSVLDSMTENNKKLRTEVDGLRSTSRELQSQVEARSKELSTAQTEIKHRETENKKLSGTVEKLTGDVGSLRKNLEQTEQMAKGLRKQVEQATDMAKKYEEITNQQRSILDTQASDLVRAQGIIGKYREDIAQLDTVAEERGSQVKSLQEQLADLKSKLSELQAAQGPAVSAKDKDLTEKLLAEEGKKGKKPETPGPKE